MSRSRNTLARHKLDDFIAFCTARGWKREPTKGDYEILRMRHPARKDPLMVHQGLHDDSMHLTTWGESDRMVRIYLNEKT